MLFLDHNVMVFTTKVELSFVCKMKVVSITALLIYNDEKIFITKSLQIEGYDRKLCAFHVSATDTEKVVLFKDFHCHGILHLKNKSRKLNIVEKDN